MKPFRSSYNRVIYLTCFALLLISLAIEGIQYSRERETLLKDLKNHVNDYANNLNVRARTAQGYVRGLQNAAQQYLFYIDRYGLKAPLYSFLKQIPDEDLYTLDVQGISKTRLGNLTGQGQISEINEAVSQELQMSLLLNTGFSIALENNPGAVWVSYTSLHGFQNLYPWFPPSSPEYYTHIMKHPLLQEAGPKLNPARETVWTNAYRDGSIKGSRYSKGRVIANIAPVYKEDQYLGVVCLDISIKELNRVVGNFRLPGGALILINKHKEVLSYSSKDQDDDDTVGNILSTKFGKQILDLTEMPPAEFVTVGSHLVYMKSLYSAPWTLVYIVKPRYLFEQAFINGLEDILIIALSLLFVVGMGYFVVTRDFISPAQKLVTHIEKENQGEDSDPSDLPERWREWFEIVTKIFAENRSLMDDLERRVKRRTAQLQKQNVVLEKTLDDLKKAQKQIILQEKLASLGGLTAGIAHEIKNPLHFIINFTDLSTESLEQLLEEFPQEKEQIQLIQENMKRVLEHAKRADSIVKGMLSHARGSDGKFEYTDVNKLLAEAVNLAYLGFCGTNHHFQLEIIEKLAPKLPKINVSPQDLSRVFLNIVNNACFAMYEKLQTAPEGYQPTLKIVTKKEKQAVLITLEDNGTGIKKSVIKKIFRPFFTTKDAGQGTGLGMSLSYEIITQQHHGDMWIESERDKFSRFYIRIPLDEK